MTPEPVDYYLSTFGISNNWYIITEDDFEFFHGDPRWKIARTNMKHVDIVFMENYTDND